LFLGKNLSDDFVIVFQVPILWRDGQSPLVLSKRGLEVTERFFAVSARHRALKEQIAHPKGKVPLVFDRGRTSDRLFKLVKNHLRLSLGKKDIDLIKGKLSVVAFGNLGQPRNRAERRLSQVKQIRRRFELAVTSCGDTSGNLKHQPGIADQSRRA